MELIEREFALQQLTAALEEAAAGEGRLALVSGEAGIGKTTLVEHFTRAGPTSARVLWGVCDALFTPRPFGPLHDMAPQLGGSLPGLLSADASRNAIFSTVLVELQSRATIAVIEDAHWADEATLDLVRFIGRRIQGTRALLILTFRDDELNPRHPLRRVLGDLAASPATRRVPLAPLSEKAVRALIGKQGLDAAQVHQQTGGNPFFVTEVLSSGVSGLPATVRDAVLARAASLSPSAHAVLEAAAVIGPRIEPWLLAELTGAEAAAADECLARGMLALHGDSLAFRHELARQAVLESISPPHRLVLHRMALDALRSSAATRDDLARLAHHAEAAHDREAILEFAPAAAHQAVEARAHRAAAALFELALRYGDDLPLAERADLLDKFSTELDTADRRPEAIEAIRQAAELWRQAGKPLEQGESLTRHSTLLQIVGQQAEAQAANRAALALLEPLSPNRELIRAYNAEAWLSLGQADNARGADMAEKALFLAQHFEAEEELPRLYEVLGLCRLYSDRAQGLELLDKALALALQLDHSIRAGNIYANLSSILVDFHQFKRAERLFDQGLPFAAERDLDSVRAFIEGWQAVLKLHQGQWEAAEAVAGAALQRPAPSPGRGPALLALGRLLTRRGDPGAEAALDESLDILLKQGFRQREGLVRAARAEAAWLAGDRQRTLAEAQASYDLSVGYQQEWYVGELAFWRWRAGEPTTVPDWTAKPYVLQMAGDWRAAAAEWEQMGCPYERARALADGDSQAQIAALEIFERLGARPAADALRQSLREAGALRLPRKPRPSTRQNPFGLTRRQVEILGLLIHGASNPEIAARLHLSPKTVDHHVTAILSQLDVHSREAAAALARQHPHFTAK